MTGRARRTRRIEPIGMGLALLGLGLVGSLTPVVADDDLENAPIEELVERLAERVGPSVVAVLAPRKKEDAAGLSFRERWWRDRGGMPGRGGTARWDGPFNAGMLLDTAEGSPLAIEGIDGRLVLTSAGAVKTDDPRARIVLPDGREVEGRLAGRDERMDLAVLVVTEVPDDLPAGLRFAETDARVGDLVFSLGNVFESVTRDRVAAMGRGIVSGIYPMPREKGSTKGRYRYRALETDAPVNPGSFGGPIVDRRGAVLGLVTSSYVSGRRLAVAVPAREIQAMLPTLARGERPTLWVGLGVIEEPGGGLRIVEVSEGGPAAEAGLAVGGWLRELDGRRLRWLDELDDALEWTPPGATLTLVIEDDAGERVIELPTAVRAVAAVPLEPDDEAGDEDEGDDADGDEDDGEEDDGEEDDGEDGE